MACISIYWFARILIMCVLIWGISALAALFAAKFGEPGGTIIQGLRIILTVVVAIYIIYLFADLISCLLGSGPLSLPRLKH